MEKHGFAFLERVVTGDEEGSRSDMALRVKAAEILADRGYGKPAQSTDITTGGGGPLKFTLGPDNGGGDVG